MHKGGVLPSPLNIKLSQLTWYSKHFNADNKYTNFLVTDKKLLKKYNEIWDKIQSLFKKEFDKKPLYNNRYISAKIDVYNGTEFKNKALKDNKHCKFISTEPKYDTRYEYLSAILLDSILIKSNKHYPQIFLKKCLYAKDKERVLLGKYIY